jgi:hypothetical protein
MKGGDAPVHLVIGLVAFPEGAGKGVCWGLTHF